ncbi:PD-(D/E)XK nuclease family protein [Pasteurella multocida]|uniref:PDDEXK-like family protein n=1 Tax=Pasteurella multocida TaxID=747 RepID=UPI0023427F51|nr:PD-(D/E)XK nuclease family protein [Pasteurella multocida]MDC4237505.1 PD-(D/E)XK nuclease family protein [Pasteurella multocida]HDR1107054.1 PD-(D/E)XK nuclease family protein [Pasteurella multocida]HDV7289656.1 PD-(D/E)XK nuclease family protein [Pasteurella multocida]
MDSLETFYQNLNLTQLRNFLDACQRISFIEPASKKKEIVIPNAVKLQQFFDTYQDVSSFFQQEKERGMLANVWVAANLGRNEVRNSKTLRWFLDASETHGQGDFFLNGLLKSLPRSIGTERIRNYCATEECCPLGEQSERVDIEIDGENFLLFIEVKIDAVEGVNQLQRYQDVAMAKSSFRPWKIIYLTPTGKVPEEHENNAQIIGLSWGNFANYLNREINTHLKHNPNNLGLWLGKQFVKHMLTF